MLAIDITLKKNNKKVEAVLWNWSPETGLFEILDNEDNLKTYHLKDVKEGRVYSDRDREYSTFEDIFYKAEKDGWNVSEQT